MKQYAANAQVPMKFHNLYVYVLNPLKILFFGALTLVFLLLALNVNLIPADQFASAGVTYLQGEVLLVTLVVVLALSFLFALIAEILLAKRRIAGVLILILGYLMEVASAAVNMVHNFTTSNVGVLIINVLIAYLVCVYYWKRSKLLR